jgi:hypothetical protein
MRAAEVTGLRIRDLNLKARHFEACQALHSIQGEWKVGIDHTPMPPRP